MEEGWMNVIQIAKHLGISKETIYRMLERKEIPAHRIGKLWRFKSSEVDRWFRQGDEKNDLNGRDSKRPQA
jgi:excisionase family DNA binding protein